MNDWRAVGLGAGGTLATFVLDHFNTLVGTACGLLTLALLSRKAFWAFLSDWRAFRARTSDDPAGQKDTAERAADGGE